MKEYKIEYLCNGNSAKMVVLASTRASAAKWACQYEKGRGNSYVFLKASRIR
jgi:hypothetical protein